MPLPSLSPPVDRADRTRTESDALASVLVLPKPTVDPPQTLLFVDEYHIKVNVPPDGDVAGMEIQYVLDDVVPRLMPLPPCFPLAPLN